MTVVIPIQCSVLLGLAALLVDGKFVVDILQCPNGTAACQTLNSSYAFAHAKIPLNGSLFGHVIITSVGYPVVTIATTATDTNLTVNWSMLASPNPSGALSLAQPMHDLMSFAFKDVVEYSYDIDHPDNPSPYQNSVDLSSMVINPEVVNNSVTLISQIQSLSLQFTFFEDNGTMTNAPFFLYHKNSVLYEFVLKNMTTQNKTSTFRLRSVVTNLPTGIRPSFSKLDSIDDTVTPGVFRSYQVISPSSYFAQFIFWKMVAYAHESKLRLDQLLAIVLPGAMAPCSDYIYLDSWLGANTNSSVVEVAFQPTDSENYFSKSNFISWSGIIGFGHPVSESFSAATISIIATCFGLPGLLSLVVGVTTFLMPRRRNKTSL